MKDEKKTKTQLIEELEALRRQGVALKITGERRQEVRQSDAEKHKTLIETTDTGYLILDAAGKVVDANREYVRISGHKTLGEIIGRSVVEWTAEHDRERNAREVAKCLQHGLVRGLEMDYVDKKGRITPIEINGTVIKNGPSFQILSLCRDISNRRKAEEALRLSEEKLSKAFQASPDWISISTMNEGRYIDVNNAYLRMTGYTREEVIGHTSTELILWVNPDDRKKA